MKKLSLSFTLLFGFSLSLIAGAGPRAEGNNITKVMRVGVKRAWKCRNPGYNLTQDTKQRLVKNKCTPKEKIGGKGLNNMINGLKVTGTAFVLTVPILLGILLKISHLIESEEKIRAKYGDNWRKRCNVILKDDDVFGIHNQCHEILKRKVLQQYPSGELK